MWKHTASCPFKPEDDEPERQQKVQANSKIMIMTAITNESNSMLNEVMASMRMDNISLVARNDKKSWNGAHREAWDKKTFKIPPQK